MRTTTLATLLALVLTSGARPIADGRPGGTRIKDIASLQGAYSVPLVGYGLVAGLNKIGSAVAAEGVKKEREKPRENPSDLSEESLRRLEKAAQSGFAWLELQPGQLRFTLPITAADAKRLKNEFAASNDEFTKALLKENSVTIGADDAGFHVTLGEGGGKPIRYTVPHPPSFPSFRKEITEYARTLKVPFKDGLTTEKVIAEFLKGGR